ncbi:regulatory protein RecX [Nonlabens ulvanivorans]|uniref:Regulatory protein RecX n=1 Tax=Nonlabens ulvanivorans TaxID=906888 RepID=A0A090X1M9_NONUL|nr:regulatory protein RecX [Nonlabens ulvanivorans]WOI22224.1 regulatory protein RecX [Nonlabens ulvanivorans]GAL73757.1 regulatory protein RecX [Nonlabens ulvanivorans]
MQQETFTVEQATRAIERYCVYQERCHKEVEDKLRKMGMIQLAIDEIIPHLIQHNFLNETRFSQSYARGKFRYKHWGRNRIIRELKLRKIGERNIKIALQEITPEEYEVSFDTLSRKRYEQLHNEKDKYRKRKKLADYLLYRGWEGDLVYDKVKELIS